MEEEPGNEIIPLNEETQIALRPETQIALSSEDENQRGVALRSPVIPSFHLNQGAFDKPNFGPQTNTKHIEANTIEHATISHVHHHYGGDGKNEESPSTSGATGARPKQKLEKGFVQKADDIFMNTKKPLKEGSKIYEGYQQHVTGQRQRIAIKAIFPCTKKSMREVEHLVKLTPHPNVVRIIRSKEHNAHIPTLYIAMELCSSKNLQDYMKENREKNTPFDFKKTMSYCKRLIKGMKHIHRNRIIHGDLKPENILFSLEGDQIKVSDFGISKQLERAKSKTKRTNQGTDGYRAPETYNFNVISMKADIFSLGVILYALFTNGKHPFGEDSDLWMHNIKKNRGRDLSGLPEEMGDKKDEFLDLLNKMLELDREKRPTIEEISMHPFFSGQATTAQASQQEEVLSEPPSVMSTTPERTFASEETYPKEGREVTVQTPDLDPPHRTGISPEGTSHYVFTPTQTQPKQEIPSFWVPMQNQPFLKVTLSPRSPEYQTAYSYFIKMGGSGNIVKIERIQNVALYKQFIAEKAEVAKKMQSKNPVERQLFHGCCYTDNCFADDKIILNGFDRSYAGKNATVYGLGVYFALEARYAIGFARPNSQGHRRMFLADVITGDYCQGHSSYKAAPPKPSGIANDVYDSVVNRIPPTIWVVFKDASAYPKFLITFT